MCGIAGIVSEMGGMNETRVRPLIDAHHGPNNGGVWADDVCALRHCRLSTADSSPSRRPPAASADGGVHLTFDGRIYNVQALRAVLESVGYAFRTRTDSEVILHAYDRWGVGCLAKLRGMFALGLWDARRRRLLLARDRIGEMPLFYGRFGGQFFFASNMRSLLAHPEVRREIFPAAIDDYLSYGYVPAPHTAFRGIYKLLPAQYLTLDARPGRGQTGTGQYWTPDDEPRLTLDEEELGAALREKLSDAVRSRMVSDGPTGAFLASGLDSNVVVGLMAQHSSEPVKTFSVGFNWQHYNELNYTRRIAERLGTDHHEFIVKPNAPEILPLLVQHYGEPHADPSAVAAYYASRLARRYVTVALNGDGGDESFARYERYLGARAAERLRAIPVAATAGQAVGRRLPDLPDFPCLIDPASRLQDAQPFSPVLSQPLLQHSAGERTYFAPDQKRALYAKDFRAQLNGPAHAEWLPGPAAEAGARDLPGPAAEAGARDLVDARGVVGRCSYLPYSPQVKMGMASTAAGLEVRSPFLDHEVMGLAARLPARLKLGGKNLNHLLKAAFADLLPPEPANQRKTNFALPVGQWLRGPLRALLCDALLLESKSRVYFQPMQIARLVDDHLNERADHSFRLWGLLMLELWQREFI